MERNFFKKIVLLKFKFKKFEEGWQNCPYPHYLRFWKSLFLGLSIKYGQKFSCFFHMSVLHYFQLFGFVFWQTGKDEFQNESREKTHCFLCVNHTVIWQKAGACPYLGEIILNLAACLPCYLEYPFCHLLESSVEFS